MSLLGRASPRASESEQIPEMVLQAATWLGTTGATAAAISRGES